MTGCIKIRIVLEQTNPKYKNDLSCGAIKCVNVTNIIDRKQFEDFKLFEVINVFTRGTQQKPMLCALLSKEIFPSELIKMNDKIISNTCLEINEMDWV